ncbi:MAG TPA: ATP-binding protein, partial [Armatimonadota bacterium]|nr:ATP-binding protein [Armatimonadota bacterium]
PSFQSLDLNDLVRQELARGMVPEGCTLETALQEDLPAMEGDPQLLSPAIRALVRNAVEAIPAGGTIRVLTCVVDDRVRLEVTDPGGELEPEVLARAFEPFFTTRRAHAGLGLPLAARVARAHGGRAFLEVTARRETTAVLELPAEP